MSGVALLLLLAPPQPATQMGAVINPDNSVTIRWTLPVDASVVGVTIIRDRLDVLESNGLHPDGDSDLLHGRDGGGDRKLPAWLLFRASSLLLLALMGTGR